MGALRDIFSFLLVMYILIGTVCFIYAYLIVFKKKTNLIWCYKNTDLVNNPKNVKRYVNNFWLLGIIAFINSIVIYFMSSQYIVAITSFINIGFALFVAITSVKEKF
ncbi:hypothetical protein KTC96_24140 (plasmid) [Clostridium estertheticum]|uniref:hypothetical protein n=1 Tax=Clostridium estertheticum TaxID=238834 RepID=UPI001C7CB464|nr:hypothetical protein [Clostridium estertheticum]MBX4262859.1 hypothetical protein [Clostridium estertheticum]WLC73214.1 hypothetical protein KTC96_24140 [Clostridium estertheticum]